MHVQEDYFIHGMIHIQVPMCSFTLVMIEYLARFGLYIFMVLCNCIYVRMYIMHVMHTHMYVHV